MHPEQITVRARDCGEISSRGLAIGEVLTHKSREWAVVGLFLGADPITGEVEEYVVLEGLQTEDLQTAEGALTDWRGR